MFPPYPPGAGLEPVPASGFRNPASRSAALSRPARTPCDERSLRQDITLPTSGANGAEKLLRALLCFASGGGIVFLQPVSETGRRNKRVSRQDGSEGGPLSKSKRARACNKAHFQRQVLRLKPVAAFVAVCCSGAALAADGPDAPAPATSDVQEVVITGLRQ